MKAKATPKPETGLSVLQRVGNAAARVAASSDGKALLSYLHGRLAKRSTFVPGDPYRTHLNEGMRVTLNHIYWLIENSNRGPVTSIFTLTEEPPIWEQVSEADPAELTGGDY